MRIQTQSNARPVPRPLGPVAATALEDEVAVSYGRVQQVSAGQGIPPATLLGHVMAHELGHVLLGEDSHSSDGIMIATFRQQELRLAQMARLLFSGKQAARMRARIREAGLRLAAPER